MASAAPPRASGWTWAWPGAFLPRRATWPRRIDADWLITLALVLALAISHGLNVTHFPPLNQFNDEGVYADSAWAVLQGKIAPYTFDYGHVPAGWFLVALWMWLTGGIHSFGLAIDSGRVLVLLLDAAGVGLLYRVARRLGCGMPAAAFGTALLVISPLAIYYQRLLLIDNLMMFWALISLNLLLDPQRRLSRLALSGLFLGVAALTKETAIVIAPGFFLLVWLQLRPHHGSFGLWTWFFPMLMVISWYPLLAILKGELLPAGYTFHWGFLTFSTGTQHVSLLNAMGWQATRTGGGPFNFQNSFWYLVRTQWLRQDAFLFAGGLLMAAVNLVRGIRDRRALAAGLLVLVPMLYLARGGIVYHFYILAVLPFFALNFALALQPLLSIVPNTVGGVWATGGLGLLLASYVSTGLLAPLYTTHSDGADYQAVTWIRQHIPPQSLIIADDTLWADLHDPGSGGVAFPNVESQFKVGLDPEVSQGIFHGDWQPTDYIILSPGTKTDMDTADDTIGLAALAHAHLVQHWTADQTWVELWKVDKPGATESNLMTQSDAFLKQRFDHGGAFAAPRSAVTSESQAYAMLRAVWSGDKPGFESAWAWTQTHLQRPDGLLAWQWQSGAVSDGHSAADADTDAALALLMAARRWSDQSFMQAGTAMVGAIWQEEVTQVHGRVYLAPGDWAVSAPGPLPYNPSYFAPYAYHVFQEVDPAHPWLALVDSGYDVAFAASGAPLDGAYAAGLPPDWLGIDRTTGDLVALPAGDKLPTTYGYDAARTYWRIALDQAWTQDGRATAYLQQAAFLRDEVARQGDVSAVYRHDGSVAEQAPSGVAEAGAISALLTLDPAEANAVYAKQVVGGANVANGQAYWLNPSDLYTQEWRWFTVALYGHALPDIWHGAGFGQ